MSLPSHQSSITYRNDRMLYSSYSSSTPKQKGIKRVIIYLIITLPLAKACVTGEQTKQKNVSPLHTSRSLSKNNINSQNQNGCTPLITAIQHYDLRQIQKLLSAGADPCRPDVEGYAPVHHAIYSPTLSQEKLALITILQRAGADINQPNSEGITPLMFAIIKHEEELADLLVSDPTLDIVLDAQDSQGQTALHWSLKIAEKEKEPALALLLIRSGASAKLKPTPGESPLMIALRKNYLKIAEELTPDSDLSAQNGEGETALFHAIKTGYVELVELFLKKDHSLADTAPSDKTPLKYALEHGSPPRISIVSVLLSYGASPAPLAEEGRETAFFHAIKAGFDELVALFLQKNASLSDKVIGGETPLEFALKNTSRLRARIVSILLKHNAQPVRLAKEGGSTLDKAQECLKRHSDPSQSTQNLECLRLISHSIHERKFKLASFLSQPPESGSWPELIPTDIILLLLSFDE